MKKQLIKCLAGVGLSLGLLAGSCISACAGEWKTDSLGRWYLNDDTSYPQNGWTWIDENNDGMAECYYFNDSGYLLISAFTPDGYLVNENGAWVQDGIVQQKAVHTAENEAKNLQAAAAYRSRLLGYARGQKNEYSYPFSFSVVDLNGDGILEVLLHYSGISAEMSTTLFYFTDQLNTVEHINPMNCTYNPQNGRLMTDYFKQGMCYTVYQFTGSELVTLADLFVSERESEEGLEQVRQWDEESAVT